MASNPKEYKRLPGRKKGFLVGKYTLYQGIDHLLLVFSRVGLEDYKRFYFNDIQAIITRKTAAGKIMNIVLGVCLLFFGALGLMLGEGGWFLLVFVDGFLLILLMYNLIKGPTCQTHLLTAVQTEILPSMHRLRTALKIMGRLKPLIDQAQGTLSREDLKSVPNRTSPKPSRGNPSNVKPAVSEQVKGDEGKAHFILFVLLLLNGLAAAAGFFFGHVLLTLLSSIIGLLVGIFGIIAVVRQQGGRFSPPLKKITWATLGFVGVSFFSGYIIYMVLAYQNPDIMYNQWELIKLVSNLPRDNSLVFSLHIFTLGGSLFLGIPGMILLGKIKDNNKGGLERSVPSTPMRPSHSVMPRVS